MKFCQSLIFINAADMVPLAVAAEKCGLDMISVPDHLVVPDELTSRYPYTEDGLRPWPADSVWVDPWVAIAAMSAATVTIRFTTSVYIAPLRDIFTVAKAVATASAMSAGRVSIGVGAGWSREEYDLVGRDFRTRGARLTEMIPALRLLWTGRSATYEGEHIRFSAVTVSPAAGHPVPVYVGGGSTAARRRAVRVADGWVEGIPVDVDGARRLVDELRRGLREADRADVPFEIIVSYSGSRTVDNYRRLADLGVTAVFCPGFGTDPTVPLASRIDQVQRFADGVIRCMGAGGVA
jgi:probable F420-dependent oxidoreductase